MSPLTAGTGVPSTLAGATANGHEVDIAVSVSPLRDSGGAVRGYSAMARDIAERKAAETELRRLLAQEERLQRQHAASAEIRLAMLSGASLPECLRLICQRGSELVECPVVAICVRDGELRIVAAVGPAAPMVGTVLPAGSSLAEEVIMADRPLEFSRRTDRSRVEVPGSLPDGPILGVPIAVGGATVGALMLVRAVDGGPFRPDVRVFAESLSAQASLALEFDRARSDREEMALMGDRERIARDLHDHVIQRLFAAGMGLQASASLVGEPRAQKRLAEIVDQLDETIRDIRNTIFGLSAPLGGTEGLRAKIRGLAAEAEASLGFAPSVSFDGPVDIGVPGPVVPHVLACVREGLSNAARHAHATAVEVRVVLSGAALTVTVADDGQGLGSPTRSSGLANLDERARLLGGSFAISARPEGGTVLEWRVGTQH